MHSISGDDMHFDVKADFHKLLWEKYVSDISQGLTSSSAKLAGWEWFTRAETDNSWLTGWGREWVAVDHLWCVSITPSPPHHSALTLRALEAKSFVLACNYARGQTPELAFPPLPLPSLPSSPFPSHVLQHYCIFKPPKPCGNSQFDNVQCWWATLTPSI